MDDRPRNTLKIMETQTAFDLNLAIRRWREDLARSAAIRCENLNELESHLRDSIDQLRTPQFSVERLRTPQLSDEEAFLIATRRVGNTQRLEEEFGKVNAAAVWFDRCLWVLVAVQLWGLISSTSTFLWTTAFRACVWLNDILPGFSLQKMNDDWIQSIQLGLGIGGSPLFVAITVFLVWRYFILPKRRGSVLLQKLLRQPFTLALSLFLVCVGFKCAAIFALRNWNTIVAHDAFNRELQTRIFLLSLPPLVLWAGLTYFIARKRLRSSLACLNVNALEFCSGGL